VIENNLQSEQAQVTVTAASLVTIYDRDVNFCDCLTSESGNECPSAGTYTVNEWAYQLPGNGDSWYASYNMYWGRSLGLKATFNFSGQTTTCETTVKLSRSSYSMVYGAAIILGLAALWGFRKRRVATIQLKEEEGTQSHFEMMQNDDGVRV
jgi:hypothetical protein